MEQEEFKNTPEALSFPPPTYPLGNLARKTFREVAPLVPWIPTEFQGQPGVVHGRITPSFWRLTGISAGAIE